MELDPIAVGLKFGFLAVLYLFLLWVTRSALKDLRRGTEPSYTGPSADVEDATGMYSASAPMAKGGDPSRPPKLRVGTAAGLAAGSAYDLSEGALLGRGDQADIRLEDGFASSHARAPQSARGCDGLGGSWLDERHVPQWRTAARPTTSAHRRQDPHR